MSEVKDEATQDSYAFPYIQVIYVPIVISIHPTSLCLKTRKNNIIFAFLVPCYIIVFTFLVPCYIIVFTFLVPCYIIVFTFLVPCYIIVFTFSVPCYIIVFTFLVPYYIIVFTFLVPCYILSDFCLKMMFFTPIYLVEGSCFIYVVFIYVFWCPTRLPYQMMFVSFNSRTTGVTSGIGTSIIEDVCVV